MKVQIRRVGQHSLPLPKYETKGAAGMDLSVAHFGVSQMTSLQVHPRTGELTWSLEILPGGHVFVGCGFAFAIPVGWEGQVRGRSGLAKKHSVRAFHVPGTIDADYRGEVLVSLENMGSTPFTIWEGDRVAQLVIAPVVQAELEEVEELDSTERGANGFGSTGTK
jgi:dUTP pyrophosphatase